MKRKNPQAYRPYKHYRGSDELEQKLLLPSIEDLDNLPEIEPVELPRRIILWDEGK